MASADGVCMPCRSVVQPVLLSWHVAGRGAVCDEQIVQLYRAERLNVCAAVKLYDLTT